MAVVSTSVVLNMLSGPNFSNLFYAAYYDRFSDHFSAHYSNGTSDNFWGSGFTYDINGVPTGAGIVTSYSFNFSADALFNVSGISIPVSQIRNAALTSFTADDFAVLKTALSGADTVYGSNYSDALDGYAGDDTIYGLAGDDTIYGEVGNDTLIGGTGNDTIDGGMGDDTAVFSGRSSDYILNLGNKFTSSGPDGTEVSTTIKVSGPDGTDTLQSVQHLRFADRLIDVPTGAVTTGTPGNDSLAAPSGRSSFNGGGGIDMIWFNFKLTDTTVTYSGNRVIVDGPSGSHTELTGFEKYVFTNGTVDNNDANPLVDDLSYYARNHDVWNAHIEAEDHYNANGWHEGRDPNAFFDTSWYLATNPDVRASGVNPLDSVSHGRLARGARSRPELRYQVLPDAQSRCRRRRSRSARTLSPVRLLGGPRDPCGNRESGQRLRR